MTRRRRSRVLVVTAATAAFALAGGPAFSSDPVRVSGEAVTLAPATAVYPKRLGYFAGVDEAGTPTVSLRYLNDVYGAAGELAENASPLAEAGAAAAEGAAEGAAEDATSYRLWEVSTLDRILNERGEVVYEDRMTFRYRQSEVDGTISGVTVVPEKSSCTATGSLAASPFHAVGETCWYVIGFAGPEVFSFVSGSKFGSFAGVLRFGTHRVEDSFIVQSNGDHAFGHQASVAGYGPCPETGTLPPGWLAACGQGSLHEIEVA